MLLLDLELDRVGQIGRDDGAAGIAEWVRLRAEWLHQVLPNLGKSFPCAAINSREKLHKVCATLEILE